MSDKQELINISNSLKDIAEKQEDIFNRLFVQNGGNHGEDCLVVQVQKNTKAREQMEENQSSERRNKWRRRGFWATLGGILLTNLWMILNNFII